MRTPQPPGARSVSATLRTAGYRAARRTSDGYRVSWHDTATIRVDFITWPGDGNNPAAVHRDRVLLWYADCMVVKGWRASLCGDSSNRHLLVTAMEGKR